MMVRLMEPASVSVENAKALVCPSSDLPELFKSLSCNLLPLTCVSAACQLPSPGKVEAKAADFWLASLKSGTGSG